MLGCFALLTRKSVLAVCVFAMAINSTKCSGQVCFKYTYAFGDSLTHNDLVHIFFEGAKFEDYGADPVEGLFNRCSKPGDKLYCYARMAAYSGAILKQVKKYERLRLKGKTPNGTFFSLEAGGNDLLYVHNLKRLASAGPGENARADATIDRIADDIREGIEILKRTPNATIVVWTVPDITITPMVKDNWQNLELNETQLSNVRLHIQRLNREIKKMADDSQVNLLDTHSIFNRLAVESTLDQTGQLLQVSMHQTVRRTAVNFPVIACSLKTVEKVNARPNTKSTPVELFADIVHPNAAVNEVVTQELVATFAEESMLGASVVANVASENAGATVQSFAVNGQQE